MNKLRKELEKAVDQAVFKTDDPEQMRRHFVQSFDAWAEERSTLGGYLRDIRLVREKTTAYCARLVGVSKAQWQSWEADRDTPTDEEINQICRGMEFGPQKREKLFELKAQAPRQRLFAIARFRPELLAARGVARVEASLEWQKLPPEVQQALVSWGEKNQISSYQEMMEFLFSLEDDQAREAWVNEVLKSLD